MAPVGQHGKLDPPRAPVVEECVDRRANRAASEEDVVHEHHRGVLDGKVDVRGVHDRRAARLPEADVVAVEGDVDVPQRDRLVEKLGHEVPQATGHKSAATVDAHDRHRLSPVLLDDLMSDAHERAPHVIAVEYDLAHGPSFLASLDRVKGTSARLASGSRRGEPE